MRLTAYRLKEDLPAYKLDRDDFVLGVQYWMDPAKITVLCRMDDGYRPACNLDRDVMEKVEQSRLLEWARL
jgi:hypothetical protein